MHFDLEQRLSFRVLQRRLASGEMCELLKIPYMPELNLAELHDSIDVSQLNGTRDAVRKFFVVLRKKLQDETR